MRLRFAPVLLLLAAQAACDDTPPAPAVRPGAAAPSAAASAPGSTAPGGIDPALAGLDIPEKLKTVDWNAKDDLDRDLHDTRDPFEIYADDMKPKVAAAGAGEGADTACQGPLCLEEAEGLSLIAILTGTSVHKAMVVDHHGMGHIVRAGDVVGKSPYRITRITRNEVVMKPLNPPLQGQAPPPEIVKRLVSDEELQELLP